MGSVTILVISLSLLSFLVASCTCNSNNNNNNKQAAGSSAMFGLSEPPVKSGARSAYQLAPFGEGFGFADLFNLFAPQRDTGTKQQYQSPFLIDDSLIINDRIAPLIDPAFTQQTLNSKTKTPRSSKQRENDLAASSKTRRLSLAGPWNRILSIAGDREPMLSSNGSEKGASVSENLVSGQASPVILVPGYGGSRLEAKLDKPSSVHYFCDSKTDWMDMWINVKQLLPYMIDCLIDNMRLEFDPTTNQTRNPIGVDIRIKNGSQVASVEYLNSLQLSGFAYFAPVIEQLTSPASKLGLERESTIRGAPYDFRKAPNELGEYFENLKESSEQLVSETGKSVTYICHSMGCNNMLYFLQRQTADWKRQHVRRLISIAAPWAGSVSAMRAAAVGDDLGMPYLFSESKLLLVQRSLPSTIFLFPNKQAFAGVPLVKSHVENLLLVDSQQNNRKQQKTFSLGDKQPSDQLISETTGEDDTKLVKKSMSSPVDGTAKQQEVYTADDFKKFFEDINHPDGYRMWLNTKDLLGNLEAPGVEVWCMVGVGKKTLARIEYSGDFPTSSSREIYDDGDGTVTIQSADYCKRWSAEQEQPVYYKQFENDHLAILKNANVMLYIERILESDLATN